MTQGIKQCPLCGGTDLDLHRPALDEDRNVYQEAECENCGATWTNIYDFSHTVEVKAAE